MQSRIMASGLTIMALLGSFAPWAISQQENVKPEPAKQQERPGIEAKADQSLKAMSQYLAGLKTYAFQVEEFIDDVQDDGQKLQFGNERRLTVRRPDRVFGEDVGDTSNSFFYYNGKTATVFDRRQKTYATVKVPGTIDAMLDDLHDRYAVHQTLADFLFADSYKALMENVQSGTYVGLHQVGGKPCHHLAFRQQQLDWQIWIDAGEQPLPRKLLITFKREVDQPQYMALLHKWDVNPKVADDLFEFQPPPGVRKVDFLNRHAEPQPLTKATGK